MKKSHLVFIGACLCACTGLLFPTGMAFGQDTYTGAGLWTDTANWDTGILPLDNAAVVVNGTCEVAENIGAAITFNPGRVTIGQGTVGVVNVTGGTLSGAHGGNNGIFVGEGAGGDGTLFIAEGAAFRSQGGGMVVRIGDDFGGVGKVTVAGELLNFKIMEVVNGTLEMLPTGINNKFNEANPSFVGANGTLAFVIDGANVGAIERSNTVGLQLTLDPASTLEIELGGSFAIDDSWVLIDYSSLFGQFSQGTSFTNAQGYTFAVDYGSGANDVVTLTLTSDDLRPQVSAFDANPPSASAGAAVELSWDVANFDSLEIDQGVGDVTGQGGQGTVTVNPTVTTTYTLSVGLGPVEVTETVTVVVDELPEIASFTVAPGTIAPGDAATLMWEVSGAETVMISEGVGVVSASGSQAVMPVVTTSYVLTASNGTGSVMADVTVTVDALEAALVHQYLAGAAGQTSGALLDGVGASNFDMTGGDLRVLSGSDHTIFTNVIGRVNTAAVTGGDNGDGFPEGESFEIWVKTGELGEEPQVIFETGSGVDGLGVMISASAVRAIQSSGGVRLGDVEVPLAFVNAEDDLLQIMVVVNTEGGTVDLSVKGAAGGEGSASGSGGGGAVGRASLFSWSGFGGAIAGALGGEGDGGIPEGLTTFQGTIALLNVYDRPLSEVEIDDAFAKWTVNVPMGDVDMDGLPDFWEQLYFGDLTAIPGADPDGDMLSNEGELLAGTDPTEADTDFDGLDDLVETSAGSVTSATNPDTDGDLLLDGQEVNGMPMTDPTLVDTDGDGFSDSVEVFEGSDPTVVGSVPTAFIGVPPVTVRQSLGTSASLATAFPGLDVLDVTFRMCVDFEEKLGGEREVLFETGGGGVGFSLCYEAGSQLALRASGSAVLGEVFYSLSAAQLAAGDLEVVFTFDVEDEDLPGNSTIALFVDGVLVGSDSDTLGGDWSGTNGASFGIALTGLAGIDGGGDLIGVDFTSGTVNLLKGLQFYSEVLYTGAVSELKITSFSYDGQTVVITFDSVSGESYSVENSSDLDTWLEVDDPTATSSSTTVEFDYDAAMVPRMYLRLRQL